MSDSRYLIRIGDEATVGMRQREVIVTASSEKQAYLAARIEHCAPDEFVCATIPLTAGENTK
jgi:hypothetical protein